MDSVIFPIVFHFHQPVDNFDHVIESIYNRCYRPLLDIIKTTRKIKFTLHFTGYLLEWFEKYHPDYLETIKDLCNRGQVELISGSYFEAILPLLPDDDKIGQIAMLSEKIKADFHVNPRGMWLAERVWEPQLPRFIHDAGLDYIIVDDNHLRSCGFSEEDTFYYYTTEDDGKVINVFPINEPVRYLAPWQPVWRLRDYLNSVKNASGDRIVLFISDAEKMGEWGTTHELCYVRGHDGEAPYIDEFFKLIENSDWIQSMTLSRCLDRLKPRGLIYIPNASYDKMEEWVLPTLARRKMEIIREKLKNNEIHDAKNLDIERFIKGGFWRSFLVKYPESNNMHKKMLHVHDRIVEYEEKTGKKHLTAGARKSLYMAQANDCYWHGQFGGVYLNFLRHSVYKHAIDAENAIISLMNSDSLGGFPRIRKMSFLKDGLDQLLIETKYTNAYVNLEDAGTIFELDFKPMSYNLMNTLARWREAYHEGGNATSLVFDKARKVASREFVVKSPVDFKAFQDNKLDDIVGFSSGPYILKGELLDSDKVEIVLEKCGVLDNFPILISKKITFFERDPKFTVGYSIQGLPGEFTDRYAFMVDFPVFFNGDPKEFVLSSTTGQWNPLDGVEMAGDRFYLLDTSYGLKLSFELSEPVRFATWAHVTFSRMNTNDYQSKYQGIGMAFNPGTKPFSITCTITKT